MTDINNTIYGLKAAIYNSNEKIEVRLTEIAKQLEIKNAIDVAKLCYECGAIGETEYRALLQAIKDEMFSEN